MSSPLYKTFRRQSYQISRDQVNIILLSSFLAPLAAGLIVLGVEFLIKKYKKM